MDKPNFAVIIAAAGKSTRFGDKHYKKPFAKLCGKAVWLHSAQLFNQRSDVKQIIVVVSPEDRESFDDQFGPDIAVLGIDAVNGGEERCQSVLNGLAKVRPEISMVAIHDAARPCIRGKFIDRVFDAASKHGAAILAVPVWSTVKKMDSDGFVAETIDRQNLQLAQTPQVFRKDWLIDSFAQARNGNPTDEAQLLEDNGKKIKLVEGEFTNIKITTKADMKFAESVLKPAAGKSSSSNPLDTLLS